MKIKVGYKLLWYSDKKLMLELEEKGGGREERKEREEGGGEGG